MVFPTNSGREIYVTSIMARLEVIRADKAKRRVTPTLIIPSGIIPSGNPPEQA